KQDLEKRNMGARGLEVDEILKLDEEYRKILYHEEKLRSERNKATNEISQLKKQGKDVSGKIKEVREIPVRIQELEKEKEKLSSKLRLMLMSLPNILHESVPEGSSEENNVVIKEVGEKTKHSFPAKSHVDLLEKLNLGDIERAAKISGARFYFLKNELVLLDMAIMKFALDILFGKGYQLIEPPFMMKKEPYEGVTDLADFENVMYKIEDEDLYLIATSEHPMAAMHMDEVFGEEQLPVKYSGVSACFRKEAGAHGKDTKGIFRVHQFNKIEQFIFCRPHDSWKYHEELIANAEEIFSKLELPYRIVNICTADIGTVAAKKYDLEVWMPVQGQYREAVSCSNCTAYQATRLNVKYRSKEGNRYVHTLNSTAIATGRAMVAILENFQQEDGSIRIPKALQPYMNGMKAIGKNR
ncbi:serine--tRNA ligase, partial [Candidatus Woesearchaeota archaeon]|nr:serine--tRNA ligase [Candidatus Woesearchaeota archaeon]